jgi:Enoyl-(Acyl carrier protein) reductase
MLRAAGHAMAERNGGAIVNLTSRLVSIGVPQMSVYIARRRARSCRSPVPPRSSWRPGGLASTPSPRGMTRTLLSRRVDRRSTERATTDATVPAGIPQRRLATPEIVAAAIAYLAADEAAHITGAVLLVDGDYTAA